MRHVINVPVGLKAGTGAVRRSVNGRKKDAEDARDERVCRFGQKYACVQESC